MRPFDVAFAIPGDLDAATGGYAYARQVLRYFPEHGIIGHHIRLPASFPDPTPDDVAHTAGLLDQIHPETPILFDGLAFGALPEELVAQVKSPIVALVHHPLAREAGHSPERQRQLEASEKAALAHASQIVTTSAMTAATLISEYNVRSDRITVAEPGTAPAARAVGTRNPLSMLSVGALVPRKGYGVLIEALSALAADADQTGARSGDWPDDWSGNWHCTIVGTPEHDPAEANRLREQIMATGLRSRITLAGRVEAAELTRLYAAADLFVLPSLYEGYGMVLAEAMARGLPIICTTGGAAAETAPDAAALKVAPGDAAALHRAIRTVVVDPETRQTMADCSWAAGQELPRWHDSVGRIAKVLKASVELDR